MGFDFTSLEPLITQILSAPGTDLATVSAKRVRRELSNLDPNLTQEFLKENKPEVDAVITRVYGRINDTPQGEEAAGASSEHKYEENGEEEMNEEDDVTPPVEKPTKKGKKKGNAMQSDAELARQLSSEINARSSTRRSTTGKGKANGTPKKARSRKSAATVDSDDEESDGSGGKKKSKRGGGGAKGGFAKEYVLSTPLATLLQAEKMSRPQVVKQLWEYIKKNERQNPSNKREIMCDDALKAVFNVEKVDMFKMNKILGQHLHENDG
ncbi:SWIB-domain-containing protein [Dendrothele bispora CBS 962.96]|uniref:SWIB-domain-containing protein n=1 Tax=Dendrothele bispora (strain CBS 962.96) TaxID=1314807 RepID=A0A4V4HBD6_DENBC|nr:SWIB-domain-containing protein [Dendrothele bispora CBS 962.96]